MHVLLVAFLALFSVQIVRSLAEVDCESDYILCSSSLPTDSRLMPEIGNGYIATVTRSDAVFVAGVFNGIDIVSHRARVPAMLSFDVSVSRVPTSDLYVLNMRDAYFEHLTMAKSFNITHRQYAHRELPNILVVEVELQGEDSGHEVLADIVSLCPTVLTSDFALQELTSPLQLTSLFVGTTMDREMLGFTTQPICFLFDRVPTQLVFQQSSSRKLHFLMAIVSSENVYDCVQAYKKALDAVLDGSIFERHRAAWATLWDSGSITALSDRTSANASRLVQALISGQYYLFSSLSSENDAKVRANGLAPSGLAHGKQCSDLQGHTFWDQETWMFPPILLLHADFARRLLDYRLDRLDAAKEYALQCGYAGARYPWESAHSGLEVVGPVETHWEMHISGDIALAFLQYLHLTNDTEWYFSKSVTSGHSPFELHLEIARFWASYVQPAAMINGTVYYGAYHVMPPDENHFYVNNSVYTNRVASIALGAPLAAWISTRPFVRPPEELTQLDIMAKHMLILFDPVMNYHPEYEGYIHGTLIKQADAIMLSYPLAHSGADMNYVTLRNDAMFYEMATDAVWGPAMTYVMHSVVWLSLPSLANLTSEQNAECMANANRLLLKCLPFIKAPFNVHTELVSGGGLVNMHTGYGGFLQAWLNGFLGIRILQDRLDIDPRVPDGVVHINVTNLDFRNANIALLVRADSVTLVLTQACTNCRFALLFYANNSRVTLQCNVPAWFPGQRFALLALAPSSPQPDRRPLRYSAD